MMNIYFNKRKGFPYWEGWGKSPHTSQKFAHSSPHLKKFPPVDSHPYQIFISLSPQNSVPQLNNNF